MFSIEIDCPPGAIRPGDLLPDVLKDTKIVLDPKNPDAMLFGQWTWVIPKNQEEEYKKVQPLIKERITDLYNTGFIRFGSW